VTELLSMGAHRSILSKMHMMYPLHHTTVNCNLEILKLLIEQGDNLNRPVGAGTENLLIHLQPYKVKRI
jgi:hypothetical protein